MDQDDIYNNKNFFKNIIKIAEEKDLDIVQFKYPIPEEIKKLNLTYAKQYRSLKLNPHKYLPNKYN